MASHRMYSLARWILRGLQRPFGGFTAIGAERLPVDGPVILAVNHTSFLDPVVAGCACPRPLHFMARDTLFDPPVFGALIRAYNAFPVARGADPRAALRACGERLDQGEAVLMFPEGTRSRDGRVGDVKGGIGLLATRHRAPVAPVYLWGPFRAWPRGRRLPRPVPMRAYYGSPIVPQGTGRDEQKRVLDATRDALRALERAVRDERGDAP